MSDTKSENQLGYGKPPVDTRFRKGQSGNPKGRPRGTKNLASTVLKTGRERVRVKGPNGTRSITKLEAVMMQLANQAAQGNLGAARLYLPMIHGAEQAAQTNNPTQEILHEVDNGVLKSFAKRIGKLSIEQSSEQPGQPSRGGLL